MISKEEIERAKATLYPLSIGDFITWFNTDGVIEVEIAVEKLLEYIQQLETEEQKVMKFLIECKKEYTEELKYNFTKRDARMQLLLVDKILEIMKGE